MIRKTLLVIGFVLGLAAQPFIFNIIGIVIIGAVVFTSKEFKEA